MAQIHRFAAITVILLTGCSSGLDGEYSDSSGAIAYKFKPSGKVEITVKVLGQAQVAELAYNFEEGKVKIGAAGGPQQVISLDKEGCLQGGFPVGKLCKK